MPLCFLSELGQCICCPENVTKTEVSSSYIFVHYYTLLQCKQFQISHPNPWTEQELVHNTTTLFSNTFHKSPEKRKKRKKNIIAAPQHCIYGQRGPQTHKETRLINKANYVFFIRQLHLFRCCLTSGLPLCLANVYDHEDLWGHMTRPKNKF